MVIAFASLGESGEGGRRGGTEEDKTWSETSLSITFLFFVSFIYLIVYHSIVGASV